MRLVPSWSGSKRPEAFGTVLERIKTPCSVWFRHGAVQTGDMYRLKMVENVYVRFKTPWSVWYRHAAEPNAIQTFSERIEPYISIWFTTLPECGWNPTSKRLDCLYLSIEISYLIVKDVSDECVAKKCKVWPQTTVNIYEFEKILWKKAAIEHAIIR